MSSGNAQFSYNRNVTYITFKNSKIPFSANIGTKVSLLSFDQLFMPLLHYNHEYILIRWIVNQCRLLILLLHVSLFFFFFFVILLLLSVITALHTGLTITCYNLCQDANLDLIIYWLNSEYCSKMFATSLIIAYVQLDGKFFVTAILFTKVS